MSISAVKTSPKAEAPSSATKHWLANRSQLDPRTLALSGVLLALWLALDVATDGLFLTPRNLSTLAVQTKRAAVLLYRLAQGAR